MGEIRVKRVYERADPADGYRVLVDRLWPRGVKKADAAVDLWLKEVAPSTALRQWFHADSSRVAAFAERYRAELDGNPALDELRAVITAHPVVTLVFAARDTAANQAVVLRGLLGD